MPWIKMHRPPPTLYCHTLAVTVVETDVTVISDMTESTRRKISLQFPLWPLEGSVCHHNIDVRSSSSSFYAEAKISNCDLVLFQTVIALKKRSHLFCDCDSDSDAEMVTRVRGWGTISLLCSRLTQLSLWPDHPNKDCWSCDDPGRALRRRRERAEQTEAESRTGAWAR